MESLYDWLEKVLIENLVLLITITLTASMALMRTSKQTGKADFLEAGMCTLFALSIWFVLGFFGLPEGACVGIGVFVAYIGTHKTSQWVAEKLNLDMDDKESK